MQIEPSNKASYSCRRLAPYSPAALHSRPILAGLRIPVPIVLAFRVASLDDKAIRPVYKTAHQVGSAFIDAIPFLITLSLELVLDVMATSAYMISVEMVLSSTVTHTSVIVPRRSLTPPQFVSRTFESPFRCRIPC